MAAPMSCRRYLFQFANEHLEFHVPEITSIAELFGIKLKISDEYDIKCPYLEVELEKEEDARKIMSRSVTAKNLCEIWSQGMTYEHLYSQLKNLSSEYMRRCVDTGRSYRIQVSTYNRQLVQCEKVLRIEGILDVLGFAGKINLSDTCDDTYRLMEYYESKQKDHSTNPTRIYFGRWICNGERDNLGKYELDKRCFISNTTMDPTLSMIMANMAKVKPGSLVWDPFVGSGSLLVSASHFGAHVMGSDIDYKLLLGIGKSSRSGQKWRCKNETVLNNLVQYSTQSLYVDVVVADTSRLTLLHRTRHFLDAIITDPPYGIREPTQKIASKTKHSTTADKIRYEDTSESSGISEVQCYPTTTTYHMSDIINDLLHLASNSLLIGARLVYWLPVIRQDYRDSQIPTHPCFRLVANCEQILNKKVSRRLLTYEKFRHIEDCEHSSADDSSTLIDDHYAEQSFRDRYFKPAEKRQQQKKQQQQHQHQQKPPEPSGDLS